ncbi:MAG: hypothetical protein ACYSUY_17955 [Planctomycetota bacterium]|jgi:hypothetical protein
MSLDEVKPNPVFRKRNTLRICAIIVITIVVSLCAMIGLRYLVFYGFSMIFDGRFKFKECKPEALISDLERVFDINFPSEIRQVKSARTSGSWDAPNTTSFFNLKFYADPDTVDTFLKSFPKNIELGEYERSLDTRCSNALHTPKWFTEPINKGKICSGIDIYIDTDDEGNFVVYFCGCYSRDLDELKKEWGKD